MLGVNITVPHKENVMPLLDKIDKEAAFIGAVNTITNVDGVLTGYNTDGRGFMASLEEERVSIEGKEYFQLRCGLAVDHENKTITLAASIPEGRAITPGKGER